MPDADPEVFEKAAELLEERGWCQDKMWSGRQVCYIGALRLAAMGSLDPADWKHAGRVKYNAAIAAVEHALKGEVDEWNDETGRTAEEVIDHMKMMAKDLRNKAKPV